MAWLKGLQDRAPPQRSGDEVRALVSESLGRPLHEVFSRFDDRAIGAASVGQVHRAELAATGEDVAVKVMYPNVENLFRADINIIANFCWLAMPHHLPALREIEKQFLSEFDYVREAENMQRIARALNSHPYFRTRVLVPKPYPALCSREVLVMEYVPGQKLVDGIRAAMKPIAQRAGTTVEELEEREKLRIREHGLLSASAASSRNRLLQAWEVCMCLVYNTAAVVHNLTLGLATGRVMDLRHVSVPPNLAVLLQLLLDVHGYEIFQVGCFNGDPHPGNVLLMPDGRLGLIDYGSCVSLALEHRQRLARLMISLLSPNPLDAVRVYSQEMGVKTKNMRSDILYKMAAFWYDRDSDDITGGMNVHSFTEWLHVQDPVTFLPDEYVMPGRVSVLLRGMGAAFGIKIQTAHAWAPHARACLASVPQHL
jgi:aarF domain-containing kinase